MRPTITIYLLLFLFSALTAQPPCLPTPGGTPAGDEAPGCVLCGPIYQGTTDGFTPTAPGSAGFSCGTIENNQFISVVADTSGVISATVLASGCLNGFGVGMVIYDSGFNEVSNCYSSDGVNTPGNVSAPGLIPGQIYWIMIDGFSGDICDILLTVSGGINTGPPDPPGPLTASPDTSPLCPGALVCYEIDAVKGASEYEWLIPGNSVITAGGTAQDTFVCLEYTAPGGGVVRVTPSNPCFPGIPALVPVVVLPILPTLKPPEFICISDFPVVRDSIVFPDAGSYEIVFSTELGCDSMVTYVFLPKVQIPNVIDTSLCPGQCLLIGDICYDSPLDSTFILGPPYNQANDCDSIIILSLNFGPPPPSEFVTGIVCPGDCFIYKDSCYSNSSLITLPDGAINGCDSIHSLEIIVADTLTNPDIVCSLGPTGNTIVINWDKITGAENYEIYINDSLFSTVNQTDYSYTPSGSEDTLNIEILPANSIGCNFKKGNSTCSVSQISSISHEISKEAILISPNPTLDIITIHSELSIDEVIIYSPSGEKLRIERDKEINLTGLPPSVYFLKIRSEDKTLVKRVIKI